MKEFFEATRVRQGELAEELGVSESAMSCYVLGKRIPQPAIALKLAERTGVPLEALLAPEQHA